MTIKYIVPPRGSPRVDDRTREVYRQIKRDFGALAEPFTLHSPLAELLAGVWMACRETSIVGEVPREQKEAVASAVSVINRCPYCVDAHTIMLGAAGSRDAADAIARGDEERISSSELGPVILWARATRSPDSPALGEPPFTGRQAPEFIGTAVFYHYINRMVEVLLGETPLPSSAGWAKRPLKRMAGLFFARSIGRPKEPGASLRFLPAAALPEDLAWARPAEHVSGAFARLAAVLEATGERSLREETRRRCQGAIQKWRGEDPGLDPRWVAPALQDLEAGQQAAARVALLAAITPYRIDQCVIDEYRAHHPGCEALLGTLAWGSFTAARRIGSWIHAAVR